VTENIAHKDLLFLPTEVGTRKGYNPGHTNKGMSNLLERVQSFMRWTTASCTVLVVRRYFLFFSRFALCVVLEFLHAASYVHGTSMRMICDWLDTSMRVIRKKYLFDQFPTF
jgi:hypothetical protein